ncbi:hypothetical protein NRIC_08290 [Enterococcus florum]|uniref:Uncharacterized protein n=1 Tax=Enterococcus florum TaxID=2480627 RepID=A0A4P5PAD4_9ENTE|nr:hypothetical protein NRIC_08290 [Enterococcus florum]
MNSHLFSGTILSQFQKEGKGKVGKSELALVRETEATSLINVQLTNARPEVSKKRKRLMDRIQRR